MKVAVLGRTRLLLEAARRLHARGHRLGLVWTRDGEAHYGATAEDFAALATGSGAAFRSGSGLGRPETRDWLLDLGCDIAISVNWPTLIGAGVRGCFRFGILNAHAGDLPRYRGNACPNWAILNGEAHVGLCIHEMADELDAGPVLVRRRLPLTPDTDIGAVYRWLEATTPELFVAAVEGLAAGTLSPQPQPADPTLVLRCHPRRPEDARIEWSRPVVDIHRLIRASSRPFAGAFSHLEGRDRVIIWRATPWPSLGTVLAVPGQVCGAVAGDPVIACADGLLRLDEVTVVALAPDAAKAAILRSLRHRLYSPPGAA